jgi:hypothetical protein
VLFVLYICRGDGTVPAGAIATVMVEQSSKSTRSGVSGHSVIRLIGRCNVIVISSISRVLWATTIRIVPESFEVVEASKE